jgi:hypothetical protein
MATGAAAGVFPSGSTFNGLPLNGLRFGFGVIISSGGSAIGNFQTTLLGTSLLGQPLEIVVGGKTTAGSVPAAGSATFSGVASVKVGNAPPTPNVPFMAAVVTNAQGTGTLTLALGVTSLPAATVILGSMTVE